MSAGWFSPRQNTPPHAATPPRRKWLSTLTDRGQTARPSSDGDRERQEAPSRARSRAGSITGLLVYDKGRLLQWLDVPVEGLRRVWRSLRHDGRHTPLERLGDASTPVRFFGGWEFKLARRRAPGQGEPGQATDDARPGPGAAPLARATMPTDAAGRVVAARTTGRLHELRPALAALIGEAVIPRLMAAHPVTPARGPAADPRAAELAPLLYAKEASAAFALIDRLRADAGSIESLCAELFEPAARTMGDLWRTDECSEFDVTLGLGRLQLALHRCSASDADGVQPGSAGRTVLLAPSPYEPHLLGSAVAVELFWRAGWDVSCDFPGSIDALSQRLHDHWYDVLDLSLSSAFTREHRLEALAATVRAARASSLNPALTVIVDGRLFHEQPLACAAVGADASCSCALDLLPMVERRLSEARLH